MRKTPLTRRHPLKPGKSPTLQRRQNIARRSAKRIREDRADAKSVAAWRAEQSRCACCWAPGSMANGTLQYHHVRGRNPPLRNHPANRLALCPTCHRQNEDGGVLDCGQRIPDLTDAHLLFVALAENPACDLAVLDSIKRVGYGPECLPLYYFELRERYLRAAFCTTLEQRWRNQ